MAPTELSATQEQRDRAKAAIIGALVADAATLGLHWLYDNKELKGYVQEKGREVNPEFFPPVNKYYTHPDGAFTPYGIELHGMLAHLSETGAVDGDAMAQSLKSWYTSQDWWYLNHSTKSLLKNIEEGKKYPETGDPQDAQADAFIRMPAVVALYFGSPDFEEVVETAVRVQQNNDKSVACGLVGARLLEKVIMGSSIEEAITWVMGLQTKAGEEARALLTEPLTLKDQPFAETVSKLGIACSLPGSLQNAVVGVAVFSKSSYTEAVRTNLMIGGDNASRVGLMGALLAVQGGIDAIPAEWRAKTSNMAEVEQMVEKLLSYRPVQ